MKNTLDGVHGRLDVTEEKISEFEDIEEKTQQKQAEMRDNGISGQGCSNNMAAIKHRIRLWLMLTSSYMRFA